MNKYIKTSTYIDKVLLCLFLLIALLIPFGEKKIYLLRPFSRSLLHRFEEKVSFAFTMPDLFEKHLHFYLSDICIVIAFFLILVVQRISMKQIIFHHQGRYLIAFLCISFLSLIFSPFHNYYFQYLTLLNLILIIMGFYAAYLFFQNRKQYIEWFFAMIIGLASLQSIIGILQFCLQGSLGLSLLGEIPLDHFGEHLASFPMSDTMRPFFELFRPLSDAHHSVIRISGTFLHANILAEFLSLGLICSFHRYMHFAQRGRMMMLFCIFLQIIALALTFSRAGMIGWLMSTGFWFSIVLSRASTLDQDKKKASKRLALFIISIFISTLIVLLPFFLARGGFVNYNSIVRASDIGRIHYQQAALHMIQENPLFGVGYDCFLLNGVDHWTHNIYLLIAAETGLVGLASFSLFFLSLILPFFSSKRTLLSTTLFAILIGFLFVGICDFYFLIVQGGKLIFFLFSAMLAASVQYSKMPYVYQKGSIQATN